MNWVQRLFHRHDFILTSERRNLLGDQDWIDEHTVSYEILGEIHVEKCSSCEAKRFKAYENGKLFTTWVEKS